MRAFIIQSCLFALFLCPLRPQEAFNFICNSIVFGVKLPLWKFNLNYFDCSCLLAVTMDIIFVSVSVHFAISA